MSFYVIGMFGEILQDLSVKNITIYSKGWPYRKRIGMFGEILQNPSVKNITIFKPHVAS